MPSLRQRDPATEEQFMGALYKGGELLASGKVVEAREHLEKAHHLEPRNEKAQNLLGLTYFKLGMFDQAAHVYELLVRENPTDPTLRVNLGLVYLKTQDLERSVKEFETATDLDAGHKKAHNYLGLALAQRGEYERARDHFVQAGSDQMAEKMERAVQSRPGAPERHATTPSAVTRLPAPTTSRVAPLPPPPPPPPDDEAIEMMSDDPAPLEEADVVSSTDDQSLEAWAQQPLDPLPEEVAAPAPDEPFRLEPPGEAQLTPVPGQTEQVTVHLDALPLDGELMPVLEETAVRVESLQPTWLTTDAEARQLGPMWVTETVAGVPLTRETPAPEAPTAPGNRWGASPDTSSIATAMGEARFAPEAFSEDEAQALLNGDRTGGWDPPPAPDDAEAGWEDTRQSRGAPADDWEGSTEAPPDAEAAPVDEGEASPGWHEGFEDTLQGAGTEHTQLEAAVQRLGDDDASAAPTPPPPAPPRSEERPRAPESEWVMQPVSHALRGTPPARASAPSVEAVVPPSLSVGFAPLKTQRLMELGATMAWVQEPSAGPFQLGPAGLAVTVKGEMLSRMTGLVAVVGAVESEPELRRRRGKPTGDAFGLGADQLQRVRGQGVLYLEASQSFESVDLTDQPEEGMDDEGAYLREELVFAFEEGLSFDNGRLSSETTTLELVHLQGNGRVLLRLAGSLTAMPVPPGSPTVVPVTRLVGWFGRVAPRLVGFGGQGAVELTGEGHALLLT